MEPDLVRLAVFVAGLAAMLAVETLRPARPWRDSRARRLGFHVALAALNALTVRLVAAAPLLAWATLVRANGWGVAPRLGLSGAAEVAASLVALDAATYWWHRWNHRVPLLWRFHKVHHLDTHVDLTTSLRFHPGELLLAAAVKAVWIAAWGPSLWAFAIFEMGVSLAAQFHHTNVDFPRPVERALRRLLVTPFYHASHHTVEVRTRNGNFATMLTAWDRVFGTYREPDERDLARLGLPYGRESYLSFAAALKAPFAGGEGG